MQRADYTETDPRDFGNWLAGFIDGEGCFMIGKRGGGPTCWFQICVRDDDAETLRRIAAETGIGSIYTLVANGTSKPQVIWSVYVKHECRRLVEILDAYPLRARKANDYEIWKRAIHVWHGAPGETRNARLFALMQHLRAARDYEAPEVSADPIALPGDDQLAFPEGTLK
jgi:hypothetical protein